ncbi:hypothetical protein N7495_001557 [Penicillium taxi]|uniref:uncharacterized protein n=1 Tax=Penicillium taxi TaxID=168475 RepID=UPI002544D7DE|nr:uncharacterized protein N7495_001557 [Penicillium taxi]KAJ5908875.1 hypothetical protein N7495_001557 [Penicillium taxi]
MSTPSLNARRRVIDSVFSPASLLAQPPSTIWEQDEQIALSFASNGSNATIKFESFYESDLNRRQKWDQAWSSATAYLSVPDRGFLPIFKARGTDGNELLKEWNRLSPFGEDSEALSYLMAVDRSASPPKPLSATCLFSWYGDEIRRHFLVNVRDGLVEVMSNPDREGLLRTTVDCLQLVYRVYLAPVVPHLLPLLPRSEQESGLAGLQRSFHTLVSNTLPWTQISPLLAGEFAQDSLVILGIDTLVPGLYEPLINVDEMEVDRQWSVSYIDWRQASVDVQERMMTESEPDRVTMARDRLLAFTNSLQLVGLGHDRAQKVFGSVMNIMITDFVRAAYTGQWEAPSSAEQHLRHWIENVFGRLAAQVMAMIPSPGTTNQLSVALDVGHGNIEKFQTTAIARLGQLRTSELFEVIVEWPASLGAVQDLRNFATHPEARYYITQSFIQTLNQRLLHPGASTVEILQLYIAIIRAFHVLDPKGVLIDRVARPIRRYLRDRVDTAKMIVGGLLTEPRGTDGNDEPTAADTLPELATELTKAHELSQQKISSGSDWHDMHWMPDPIDAAPGYRKSKSLDVIDSLISIFDSKEVFVKELQTLLCDRLLQNRKNFDLEIKVLDLLKARFGDSALQSCEVMLGDMEYSQRVNNDIRFVAGWVIREPTLRQPRRKSRHGIPDLHSKILSRFFWPEIQDQPYKIPGVITALQEQFSNIFARNQPKRHLEWRNSLGQATVELKLGDRTVIEEVTTWQATVIYAFHGKTEEQVTRTIDSLVEELEMAAPLVRSACLFWTGKRVLKEIHRDIFRVLEFLPAEGEQNAVDGIASLSDEEGEVGEAANAAAAAEAAAVAAAKETAEAAATEKMNLYWQFIVGMLTNQGSMPLERIVMMLKIVVPGGFPFSNEELQEFLAGMVSRGKLTMGAGGNYKVVH